jgi:tetratricopeptide (TPR) repeat protein
MRIGRSIPTILAIACQSFAVFAQGDTATIQSHLQKARNAIAHHDLRTASDEYREILKLDPGNAEISAARGISLYALGESVEATRCLKAALAADPRRSDAETFLGLSLADSAECHQALPLLEKSFQKQLEARVRRLVGLSLLGCSASSPDSDRAIDVARQLTRGFPDDPDVLYETAELYSQLSKQAVNELLKKHPDSYRIHELAGEALEAQNNNSQALLEYRKALELTPKAPHLHYRIGSILLGERKDASETQALEHFKQEILVNPGDAPSEYQIAEILRKRNQFDSACAHFTRALELNPQLMEAHIGLAKISMSRRQFTDAVKHLQASAQLAPEDPAPHYSLMVAYREMGRVDEAKQEMATVEELNAKKRSDFDNTLRTLLTGQRDR